MCPCCCCHSRATRETSALGSVVQLKSLGLAAYPISAARKEGTVENRIGHPDGVKLSVELNCAPNQNTKFSFYYKIKHHAVEKEAAAIVEALRKWCHFLLGRHFKVITDQKSVSFIFDNSKKIKN